MVQALAYDILKQLPIEKVIFDTDQQKGKGVGSEKEISNT